MEIGSFLLLVAITTVVVGVAMLAMAVGAMFKRKCLHGSCGGPAPRDANGELISCRDCPNRAQRGKAPTARGRRLLAAPGNVNGTRVRTPASLHVQGERGSKRHSTTLQLQTRALRSAAIRPDARGANPRQYLMQ